MSYFVYILASKQKGTLYTGSTNNIARRVSEHKEGVAPGFTKTYAVTRLVLVEQYRTYAEAAQREKRIKKWPRRFKLNLIEASNPEWRDLYGDLNS